MAFALTASIARTDTIAVDNIHGSVVLPFAALDIGRALGTATNSAAGQEFVA